jgi:signal peptidase II
MADALRKSAANPAAENDVSRRLYRSRWIGFAIVAILGCLIDLVTKSVVFAWRGMPPSAPYWVIDNHLGFETALNPGALFGIGAGMTWVFVTLSLISVAGILYWLFGADGWRERVLTYTLAAITAGILGNLYDRLGLWHVASTPEEYKYRVRDWILFQLPSVPLKIVNPWPNFNLADSWIVCGVAVLLVGSFFARETDTKSS